MTDGWIAAGAILTGVGSLAIATQAWLTRDLVKATKQDLATGRDLVVEATKTRLDERGPRVAINVTNVGQLQLMLGDYGEPQQVPLDRPLRSPDDNSLLIATRVDGEIINDGRWTAHVITGPGITVYRDGDDPASGSYREGPLRQTRHSFAAGERRNFVWWAVLPFSDWIENVPEVPINTPTETISVKDVFDEGVLDEWELIVDATPFYEDSNGTWRVVIGRVDGEVFKGEAQHQDRTYFESRLMGLVLGDIGIKKLVRRRRWNRLRHWRRGRAIRVDQAVDDGPLEGHFS